MDKNEICLKTRKQLLFVQCFPLFWSPVFPCFACTVNMRLGSCCSVGENSCKSRQEVGKNSRVSLFHCYIVSLFHYFTVSLFHCFFLLPAQSFSISWITQSLFSIHALELYFVHLPMTNLLLFPPFCMSHHFSLQIDFVGSRVLCLVVQGFGDPLIFSVFPQSKQCLAENT